LIEILNNDWAFGIKKIRRREGKVLAEVYDFDD
jgi:hypothetical protein